MLKVWKKKKGIVTNEVQRMSSARKVMYEQLVRYEAFKNIDMLQIMVVIAGDEKINYRYGNIYIFCHNKKNAF